MDDLTLFGDKRMTVKEVAEALGVDAEAIKKHVRELYPSLMRNGLTTYLDEKQVTEIKRHMIPTTEVAGALTSLDIEEMTIKVIAYHKAEADRLRAELAKAKPKIEFFDAVTESNDTIDMGDVAKVLNTPGYGRTNLFALLRGKKILMHNNIPYQEYIDRGYFKIVESTWSDSGGMSHVSVKTVVYQKGLDYIRKIIVESKE